MQTRTLASLPALLFAFTLAGCDEGKLEVRAFTDILTATPESPVAIEVTATNVGTERVVWGRGSSSCQLSLVVVVSGAFREAIAERGCTDDLAQQGLDPGESRSEVLPWAGRVREDGEIVLLPPGTYSLRGAAGTVAYSPAGSVTVMVSDGSS